MRIRLSDPAFTGDLAGFLWRAGFIVEQESRETVRVSVPLVLREDRTEEEMELFLAVWLNLSLRVWNTTRPNAEALVVA